MRARRRIPGAAHGVMHQYLQAAGTALAKPIGGWAWDVPKPRTAQADALSVRACMSTWVNGQP